MPYIITVLALIVVGVGFTLFTSNTEVAKNESIPQSIEATDESIQNINGSSTAEATTTNTDILETPTETKPIVPTTPPKPVTSGGGPTPPPSPTPIPVPVPVLVPVPVNTNDYKNGSYSTQTSYRTPDGTYQMDVTLTVSNDKIIAATVGYDSQGARDGYSKRFSSAYKSAIIGQDLGSANLSRVGGASLTTNAFNKAVSSIRTQAT